MTIFCQTTALINFLYVTHDLNIPDWLQAVCCYYFVAVVCILAILRANEPIVWHTLKKDLGSLCRRRQLPAEIFDES